MIGRTKRTLWVLTDYSPINDFSDVYWRECFLKSKDFQEYNVRIIEGQYIGHESFLYTDLSFKHKQMKSVLDLFASREVKDGDVFIFANAWNFVAIPLSFFRDEYQIDFKMVGFWGNSIFNPFSPLSNRLKNKNTGFEMSLFKTYDLNCFLCEEQQQMFSRKHPSSKDKCHVTGYPFGYLKENIKESNKENIIFNPWPIKDEIQSRVWKSIKHDHHLDYTFLDTYSHKVKYKDREKYTELFKVSKFMFSAKEIEHDPVFIYEAMLNGVVPFLQRRHLYQIFFHEDYLIPKINIVKRNNMISLMRHRMEMLNFFMDRISNYEIWKERVIEDAAEMGNKYYSNDKFLFELNKLINE